MGPFEMVVLLVLIGTIGKTIQSFAHRPRVGPGEQNRMQALEAELRSTQERLLLTEDKVADLNEKLGFMEKLLANPESAPAIPAAPRSTASPLS